MQAHTSGPWTIEYTHDQRTTRVLMAQVRSPGGELVHTTDLDGPDGPRFAADARLIAAAPDLLEAARFCLDNAGGPPVDMLSRLRAAVLKAEPDLGAPQEPASDSRLAVACWICRAPAGEKCKNYKGQNKQTCPQRGKHRPEPEQPAAKEPGLFDQKEAS